MKNDDMILFVALWPPLELQQRLGTLAKTWAAHCGGRAMRSERIHLTLVYLGNASREQRANVEAALAQIEMEPIKFVIDRAGHFARKGILWVGPTIVPDALVRLQVRLREALSTLGFVLDSRPFTPHITLVREARRPVDLTLPAQAQWCASSFCLVQSESSPPAYRTLQTYTALG